VKDVHIGRSVLAVASMCRVFFRRVWPAAVLVTVVGFVATHGVVLVTGGSMCPTLSPGDLIVYRRGIEPVCGDLLVFEAGTGLVVHRAIRVDPRGAWITKGDANEIWDRESVISSKIRGVGRLVVPLGRSLRSVGRPSPLGLLQGVLH